MIEVISWNIRWGRGHDGVVNLARIIDTAMAMGDPDILCFQEVARSFPEVDGEGVDQPALLSRLLPDFEVIFSSGTNVAGADVGHRREFGNLVMARLPVLQAFSHPLPRPSTTDTPHMQRTAQEIIIAARMSPLRIINTHLEYHSAEHRAAQVERLRSLYRDASTHSLQPESAQHGDSGPYVPPAGRCPTLLCGDFNMEKSEPAYTRLLDPFDDRVHAFEDAWTIANPGKEHPITCGVYELVYWSSAHCRDFFFITTDLAHRVRTMDVDEKTNASDHQPLRLVLDDAAA
ncbi:MAG: endonuclease/exonuclease/phosphatase family protein [Acidiferrobacterales bacterium]